MGLGQFCISLDRPERRYNPSDMITGRVVLVITGEPEKIDALEMTIRGVARVEWNDTDKTYKGEEILFETTITDVNSFIQIFENIRVPIGRHEIPFETTLPADLPYSFESKFGGIRYRCEVVLKRKGFLKTNETRFEAFHINQGLDLNANPTDSTASVGVRDSSKVVTCSIICCLRNRGEIEVNLELPRKGYVPGEVISIDGYINNNSTIRLYEVNLALEQCILYLAGDVFDEKKTKKETIVEKTFPLKLMRKSTKVISGFQLTIPPTLEHISNAHCSIIQLHYRLRFNIDASFGFYKFPLIIGSVPLNSNTGPTSQSNISNNDNNTENNNNDTSSQANNNNNNNNRENGTMGNVVQGGDCDGCSESELMMPTLSC